MVEEENNVNKLKEKSGCA